LNNLIRKKLYQCLDLQLKKKIAKEKEQKAAIELEVAEKASE
jgi:hypothetical protein